MLAHDLLRTESDKALEAKENHHQIIDLTQTGQKVGQEIHRRKHVGQQQNKQELWPHGDATVF